MFRLSLVPGNKAPSASINVALATTGLGAAFSATVGDDDGTVARVEWDFDDDGAFDDGNGTSEFWTFPAAGHVPGLGAGHGRRRQLDDRVAPRDDRGGAAGGAAGSSGGGAAQSAGGGAPRAPVARLSQLSPWPVVRMAGSLTDRGADLRLLSVKAPRGARIAVRCQGALPAGVAAPRRPAAGGAAEALRAEAARGNGARDPRELGGADRQVHAHRHPQGQGAGAARRVHLAGQARRALLPGLSLADAPHAPAQAEPGASASRHMPGLTRRGAWERSHARVPRPPALLALAAAPRPHALATATRRRG